MNIGYILFCNQSAFGQCVSKRLYSCAGKQAEEAKRIPVGAVLFIFNTDAKP